MKLSVITVSYNSEKYIRRTIESVNQQDYFEIEHIFIDAFSNDSTLELIKLNSKRSPIIVSEPDSGLYFAMNKGLKIATGDYITFLNSDDYYKDNSAVSDAMKAIKEGEGEVLFSNVQYINSQGFDTRKYKSFGFKSWMFSFGFMPAHPGSFIKTSVMKNVGLFDTQFKIAADFDYFSRVFLLPDLKMIFVDKMFVVMQEGGISSKSFKSNLIITHEMHASLSKNGYLSSYIALFFRLPIKFFALYLNKLKGLS